MSAKKIADDERSVSGLLNALRALRVVESTEDIAELREAVTRVLDEVDAIGIEDVPEAHERPSVRDALQAGLHLNRKQYGRHDKRRDPAGYQLVAGDLVLEALELGEPDARTVAVARALLKRLASLFKLPAGWREVLSESPARQSLRRYSRSIESIAELWMQQTGEGRPVWAKALEDQLHMDAVHREAERLRDTRGLQKSPQVDSPLLGSLGDAEVSPEGSFDGPASGAAILEYLRWLANGAGSADAAPEALPAELTAEAIEEMRGRVGLNKGGRGGKKTARAVVDEFLKGLAG